MLNLHVWPPLFAFRSPPEVSNLSCKELAPARTAHRPPRATGPPWTVPANRALSGGVPSAAMKLMRTNRSDTRSDFTRGQQHCPRRVAGTTDSAQPRLRPSEALSILNRGADPRIWTTARFSEVDIEISIAVAEGAREVSRSGERARQARRRRDGAGPRGCADTAKQRAIAGCARQHARDGDADARGRREHRQPVGDASAASGGERARGRRRRATRRRRWGESRRRSRRSYAFS